VLAGAQRLRQALAACRGRPDGGDRGSWHIGSAGQCTPTNFASRGLAVDVLINNAGLARPAASIAATRGSARFAGSTSSP